MEQRQNKESIKNKSKNETCQNGTKIIDKAKLNKNNGKTNII